METVQKNELLNQIEETRQKLNREFDQKSGFSPSLLLISRELDLLINEYYSSNQMRGMSIGEKSSNCS